ncbi:MAG TPA: biotin/lipoyl-binding carrier protein [Burkholderiaceae bacterium]|nr:biotin/lipoyl-binding carrier protein [Burkholderiaceae bacterium]
MHPIRAEVTGSVWKVLKAAGEAVAVGDEILLIESMKMEIPVVAERAGRVHAVLVKEGEPVREGQVVAEVAPQG